MTETCGGLRRVEAFVSGPTAAREALGVLGIPFDPLQLEARDPPSQQSFHLRSDGHGIGPIYLGVESRGPARAASLGELRSG